VASHHVVARSGEGVVPLEFGLRRGGLFGGVVGSVPDRYVHAAWQAFRGFHDEELGMVAALPLMRSV
jgi:hypothetical protein